MRMSKVNFADYRAKAASTAKSLRPRGVRGCGKGQRCPAMQLSIIYLAATSPPRTGASSSAAPPLRRATQNHHVLSIGAAKARPLCPPFRRPIASCATCALPSPQPNASDRHICRCLSVRPVESMSRIVGGATCRGRAGPRARADLCSGCFFRALASWRLHSPTTDHGSPSYHPRQLDLVWP